MDVISFTTEMEKSRRDEGCICCSLNLTKTTHASVYDVHTIVALFISPHNYQSREERKSCDAQGSIKSYLSQQSIQFWGVERGLEAELLNSVMLSLIGILLSAFAPVT